eukprot:TRINITY_DN18666_c0_g1_i2.p1 TRINITY_DN18666_c0_g1~~TRINITY_DN18666_c0_g1_i2.p1  ORF type:complete len:175 (-),score=39.54 TRINITY_DN18666_c0_g1_i2:257-781(-)
MIRRPPRSTLSSSSAASDVYKRQVESILNTAPAREEIPAELLEVADIVCPNQPELSLLTGGMPTDTVDQAAAAAHELLRRGPSTVLCTLGKEGCLLVKSDGSEFRAKATHHVPTDTAGAGDCFLGAFAHFYSQGAMEMEQAILLANKASGLSVTRRGTQLSFPFISELEIDSEP